MAPEMRILLVEFINADQFPGQVHGMYPFFKSYLSHHGVPNARLRFAIAADNQFRHGRDAVTLDAGELARLEEGIRRLRANAVFTTHPLYCGQGRSIRERFPGLRLETWGSEAPLTQEILRLLEGGGAAQRRFDPLRVLEPPRIALDYGWEEGNPASARADRNLVYLETGGGCRYSRSVRGNPCYVGVDLPQSTLDAGCAFCEHGAPPRPFPEARVRAWVSRQLRGIRRSLGPGRLPSAVILESMAHVRLLDHILRTMRRLGMAETALLIATRADHLLKARPLLMRTLRRLRGRGEAVHIHTLGLENFSDQELLRFNKGFGSLTAIRAVNALRELEVRFPRNFHYSGYMPLGMILFTPWTRLADLYCNLRLIQHLGLEYELGNLFMSRLRLHEHLPITALAVRDGLTADSTDAALRLNRRKLFGRERSWRFQDPRMEPVGRLAMRLSPSGSFAGDALYERIRAALPEADRRELTAVLLCIVEAAGDGEAALGAEDLFARALALWRRKRELSRPPQDATARFRLGQETLSAREYLERVLPLVAGGDKPVLSLEGLNERDRASLSLKPLLDQGFSVAFRGTGPARTLHVSRRWAPLERLLALEAPLAAWGRGSRAAHAEAGRLFGYPDCCVRAWLRGGGWRTGIDGWALLGWRLKAAGPVPRELNPLLMPDLAFLPCSARCDQARRRYRRWYAAAGVAPAQEPRERVFLFCLDSRTDLASFLPTNSDPREIRYDSGSVQGVPGRLRAALLQGDRIVLLPAQVEVWSADRPVARWVAEAALWDPRFRVDPEAWTELVKAAFRRKDPLWRRSARRAALASRAMALDRPASEGRAGAEVFRATAAAG